MEHLKKRLHTSIDNLELSGEVVDLLLPNGQPYEFETELWDYKKELPSISDAVDKKEFDYKLHGIIKDIVAFHNSYGGYLLFGVLDKGAERVAGCEHVLDCDDLTRRILASTGVTIQCYFGIFDVISSGKKLKVGLLCIPRRKAAADPVKFVKISPLWNEKRAYNKNEFYIRRSSECIPATNSAEDWQFLFSGRELGSPTPTRNATKNNLPSRDRDLIEFVGRKEELEHLRKWMLDDKSPVHLLTGIGGLGKTSLAYKFANEVARLGAPNIDAVLWLTAKKETYAALRGQMVPTTRHDFSKTSELLNRLTIDVCGSSSIDEDMETDDLVDTIVDGLAYTPSLIVIDDLDSLEPSDQKTEHMISMPLVRALERAKEINLELSAFRSLKWYRCGQRASILKPLYLQKNWRSNIPKMVMFFAL